MRAALLAHDLDRLPGAELRQRVVAEDHVPRLRRERGPERGRRLDALGLRRIAAGLEQLQGERGVFFGTFDEQDPQRLAHGKSPGAAVARSPQIHGQISVAFNPKRMSGL